MKEQTSTKMAESPMRIREQFETVIYALERPLGKQGKLDLATYVRGLRNKVMEELNNNH